MRSTLGYPAQIPIRIAITAQKHCRDNELCLPKWLNVLAPQPTTPSHPKVWLVTYLNFSKVRWLRSPSPPAYTRGHRMVRSSRCSWWITCTLRGLLWRGCNWDNRAVPPRPALPTPAVSRSEGPLTCYTCMAHPGVGETPLLYYKCIKQRWIGREPGVIFMLKHTGPGRSKDCSW